MWALEEAERHDDHDQAYYHAINVAFLDLISLPFEQPIPQNVHAMAQRAKQHCLNATHNYWQLATQAEADMMLGDLTAAETLYLQAITGATSPRSIQSMYSQAIRVAERVFGERGAKAIERVFGLEIGGDV